MIEQAPTPLPADNPNGGERFQENLDCLPFSVELADLFQKLVQRFAHIQARRMFSREETNERR